MRKKKLIPIVNIVLAMIRATCVMREIIYPFLYETTVLEYDRFFFFSIFIK